jgi:hypothetical protein
MSVRVMTSVGLLYQDLIKQKKLTSSDKLPQVFPMVIYTGSKPWTAPLGVKKRLSPEVSV